MCSSHLWSDPNDGTDSSNSPEQAEREQRKICVGFTEAEWTEDGIVSSGLVAVVIAVLVCSRQHNAVVCLTISEIT